MYCPACDGEMGVRDSHFQRGKLISRHFFHRRSGVGCTGESATHKRLKAIAHRALEDRFENATVQQEVQIGARIADVRAKFPTPVKPFGNGLVVEVQHKHDAKDFRGVTSEYLQHGYAVFWAFQGDFEKHELNIADERLVTPWPDAVPSREGLEGYPEPVQQLKDPAPTPVEMDVPLPDEYLDIHRLEIKSPATASAQAGWDQVDDVWIHGKGQSLAWINLLESPLAETYIEVWRKNKTTGETEHLPLRIEQSDIAALREFVAEAAAALDEGSPFTESQDVWEEIATVWLSGTVHTEGWVALAKPPASGITLIAGRRDERGNSNTIGLDYRDGDIERFARLLPLAANSVGH